MVKLISAVPESRDNTVITMLGNLLDKCLAEPVEGNSADTTSSAITA